ncbi:hypothetical protein HOY82DRAFT_574593 [Tuber indicum]|nr:hypothetical protein HOY82DRAFT_574593 [Tuber indicum]
MLLMAIWTNLHLLTKTCSSARGVQNREPTYGQSFVTNFQPGQPPSETAGDYPTSGFVSTRSNRSEVRVLIAASCISLQSSEGVNSRRKGSPYRNTHIRV